MELRSRHIKHGIQNRKSGDRQKPSCAILDNLFSTQFLFDDYGRGRTASWRRESARGHRTYLTIEIAGLRGWRAARLDRDVITWIRGRPSGIWRSDSARSPLSGSRNHFQTANFPSH